MITVNDICKGDLTIDGTPFIKVSASSTIKVNTLQYTVDGMPWWGVSDAPVIAGHIKSINGVAWEHIKSYCGIDQAHIKTAMGVEG